MPDPGFFRRFNGLFLCCIIMGFCSFVNIVVFYRRNSSLLFNCVEFEEELPFDTKLKLTKCAASFYNINQTENFVACFPLCGAATDPSFSHIPK